MVIIFLKVLVEVPVVQFSIQIRKGKNKCEGIGGSGPQWEKIL